MISTHGVRMWTTEGHNVIIIIQRRAGVFFFFFYSVAPFAMLHYSSTYINIIYILYTYITAYDPSLLSVRIQCYTYIFYYIRVLRVYTVYNTILCIILVYTYIIYKCYFPYIHMNVCCSPLYTYEMQDGGGAVRQYGCCVMTFRARGKCVSERTATGPAERNRYVWTNDGGEGRGSKRRKIQACTICI